MKKLITSPIFASPINENAEPALRELAGLSHYTREIKFARLLVGKAAALEAANANKPLAPDQVGVGLYGYTIEQAKKVMGVIEQGLGNRRDVRSVTLRHIVGGVREMLYETPDKSAVAADKMLSVASVFASEIDGLMMRRSRKRS